VVSAPVPWDGVVAQYEQLRAFHREPGAHMCRARAVLQREGMAAWMRLSSRDDSARLPQQHAPRDVTDPLIRGADQNELTLVLATMTLSCLQGQQEVSL
jgi:hypothetical protein